MPKDSYQSAKTEFPAWALAARIVFASSPNSASCERVFALLRNLFGELQMKSLADYVQAALMLNYTTSATWGEAGRLSAACVCVCKEIF